MLRQFYTQDLAPVILHLILLSTEELENPVQKLTGIELLIGGDSNPQRSERNVSAQTLHNACQSCPEK